MSFFDDDHDSDYDERPFAPEERRAMRKMREEWDRSKWFLKLFNRIAAWTAATLIGVWASRESIAKAVKWWLHI